ncbi:GNAT family N-acetyltransferase [Cupriavidus gilardii]|uniref:GNAT family N-acetyltransferase n=2 Tax=Cupriavidus gilardii TaxID=82541 RepID=A0A849BFR0_9BURK|nr:GNAT family N-acetyltransferase [Cupriavidus gilardii]KAB0594228.1 GNAT family N-acetyltransferase [Cupriavidus gilardii]MCT9016775.1 GNAT family N-acetyltransferase [Cupriavidus gilardii]MCT9056422.1 GNAT family N-acetyltransferase [Cupriavidus gilardii]NNH12948.1 GNAT family N-acetyltransferase [Cupriavidus gilardii]WNG69058.1 GNAT family N-acetyltransferase [Cupriavidus gilardii]
MAIQSLRMQQNTILHEARPMKIRRGLECEAPLLTEIANKAKAHWPYTQAQLQAWREDLTITGSYVAQSLTYVAEIDGSIAGFHSVFPTDAVTWALEHLWVAPDYMRRGVGRALLRHAAALAAGHGVKHLTIDAEPYAEPFYLACGAQRIGTVAAPLDGEPLRQRPQMLLATSRDLARQ